MFQTGAALAFYTLLAACALAQDAVSFAALEQPLLDPVPSTDRVESTEDPEFQRLAEDLDPVSTQQQAIPDGPANVRGTRMERRWRLIPFGRVRTIFTDNLFISPTTPEEDFSYTLSPGIAFGWGDYEDEVAQLGAFGRFFEALELFEDVPQSYVFARYLGSASYFIENPEENEFDHDALIAGRFQSTKLTLGLRARFQTLSGSDIDIGDRVDRRVFTSSLTTDYKMSEKTSLGLNLFADSFDFDFGVDSSNWMGEALLNYQIRPKTTISAGARFGITDIVGGSEQTYQQIVARLAYLPSEKLGFTVDGGLEWRQFDTEEGDEDTFTVFNLSATYAPFDGTTVNLNAFRRNNASAALFNETITATGVAVRARQRVRQRFYLTVDAGFTNAVYTTNTGAFGTFAREDDTLYVKPSISFDITRYLSVESAYQYQRNESSFAENSFRENLVSMQFNLQF